MEDNHRYIYFYTKDFTGNYTTSGYSLPITPFTFIPVFDDGDTTDYSKQKIYWDFGDGTTSNSVTATHTYRVPGWYNVRCYVLGREGKSFTNSFVQNLLIYDYVSDTIVLSGFDGKTEAGTPQNPYRVYRFNSWQTYNELSATGYTIRLHVSGNNSPMLDVDNYYKDKWGHLKPSARFETLVYNSILEKEERLPVNTLKTSNDEIYVRNINNRLELCKKTDAGACFAGTSGEKVFFFIDDIPKKVDDVTSIETATIYANLDVAEFKDLDSYSKNYPLNNLGVLNSIYDTHSFSVIIEQLNADHLTITSNGIDDDNNGKLIDTFKIYQEKYTDQKIQFVVKIKNEDEISTKYNPILKITDTPNLSVGQVYLELRNERNEKIEGVQFFDNIGILSAEQYGGYFKGYLVSPKQLENVHIYGKTVSDTKERYLVNTTYGVISEPQADKIHNLRVRIDTGNTSKKILEDKIVNVPGLTGIYSSCVTYQRNPNGTVDSYTWVVDADRDKIRKYNSYDMSLVYDDFDFPENSSPSNICSEKYGHVWVTLYDSISTVRINNETNGIDLVITPSIENEVRSSLENTVTPAAIDTDYKNNVWVSYSNQVSSFIEKYDSDGVFISQMMIPNGYQSTEIVTDLKLNLWGVMKDNYTQTETLSDKQDLVFKIDQDLNYIEFYYIHGSLWNITVDCSGNPWITKNINEISKINTLTNTICTFEIGNNSYNDYRNYISNLEGLACTTDNTILVIDNKNRQLHYFNANFEQNGFVIDSLKMESVGYIPPVVIQDKLNAYGDWNGFRHINKFQHIFPVKPIIEGTSNTFSIFDSISGKYEIRKINENFDPLNQMKMYRFQDYLKDSNITFNSFFGNALGTLSSNPNHLGKYVYERIANFMENNSNIDTCTIRSLRSMYEMLDEKLFSFNGSDMDFPAELIRLMDMFSMSFSKLKGSRNLFDQDYNTRGYLNDSLIQNNRTIIYGKNKGRELNFFTSVLTAGVSIIAYEHFSQTYKFLNTDIQESGFIKFINPIIKTYNLSSYNPYWGWGLVLPFDHSEDVIPRLYTFHDGIKDYDFATSILTAGQNLSAIQIGTNNVINLNTNLESYSANYVNFLDNSLKTFRLSTYHPKWNWDLSLVDPEIHEKIPRYYSFYEYIPSFNYDQNEGIINWSDENTNLTESVSTNAQWDEIRENMLNYSLAKGLGIIK